MIELEKPQRKLVIPRWRHWKIDLIGDIANDTPLPKNQKNLSRVNELRVILRDECLIESNSNRTIARLANEAILFGEIEIALKMAKKLSDNRSPLESAVRPILPSAQNTQIVHLPKLETEFIKELEDLKAKLIEHPKNAILWIERARIYTILGQKDKAIKSAKIALGLEPYNRYIVRSSARLFMHFDAWDMAWQYSLNGFRMNSDPWLKSLAVSIGTRAEVSKTIPNFSSRINEASDRYGLFTLSELNAATGMLELVNGNDTKAKKLFRYAWQVPASTVISHGVWIINNDLKGLANSVSFDLSHNTQATAYTLLNQRKYKEVIPVLNEWLLEEPYSSEAHGHLCTAYLNLFRYDEAIRMAEQGFKFNCSEYNFLNLQAYAMLRKDNRSDWKSAGEIIEKMEKFPDYVDGPVPRATKGMYFMLNGEPEKGIDLYKSSLRTFKSSKAADSQLVCGANLLMNIMRIYNGIPTNAYEGYVKKMRQLPSNYVAGALAMLEHEAERYGSRTLNESEIGKHMSIDSEHLI